MCWDLGIDLQRPPVLSNQEIVQENRILLMGICKLETIFVDLLYEDLMHAYLLL